MKLSQPVSLSISLLLHLLFGFAEAKTIGPCVSNVQGSRCSQPGAHWQYDGVCIKEPSKSPACHVPDTTSFKFKLVADIQQKDAESIKTLWVCGSGPSLSWDKPKPMKKSARSISTWIIEISYASDSNALLCLNSSYCSLNQQALELRVYRDEFTNDDMKGPNIYIPLPVSNSMSGAIGFVPPRVYIHPWFDGTSVRSEVVQLSFNSYIFRADETVSITSTILYPPSFDYNVIRKYPLIVMFGTNESSHIAPSLEHMYVHEASIKEAVVVSIHYLDKAPFCRLNPFNNIMSLTEGNTIWNCRVRGKRCTLCQNCWDPLRPTKCSPKEFIAQANICLAKYACSGSASDILDFIEDTLILELQKRTQNRLQLDFPKQRMSVIGFSGAGLLACFAALSRPMYYVNAACLSAPFQWPLGHDTKIANRNNEGIGRLIQNLTNTLASEPASRGLYMSQKYYIDNGELDNFYLPLMDAHDYTQWVLQLLTKTLQLTPENILYFNVPKAGNSYHHHKDGGTEVFNRIRQPLTFFLKAEGGPNKKYARVSKLEDTSFAERQSEIGITEQDLDKIVLGQKINKSEVRVIEGQCSFIRKQKPTTSVPISAFLVSICELSIISKLG